MFYLQIIDKEKTIFFLWYRGCQEGRIAKDIEDILTGRDQDGLALADADAIDVGLAPEADNDDEGVAVEVYLLGDLNNDAVHDKIGTADKLGDRFGAIIRRPVSGPDLIVNGILSLFDVQFTWIAMNILTTKIIDAVSNV